MFGWIGFVVYEKLTNKRYQLDFHEKAWKEIFRFEEISVVLILTRRVGESVKIDNSITVSVLGIKGNQIRLGVDAPKHVSVHREEVFQRMRTQETDAKEKI